MTATMSTRQRRLLFRALPIMVVLVVLVAAALFGAKPFASSAQASSKSTESGLEQVTVGYGDTLWSIAHDVAPGQDRGTVIDRIAELNELEGSSLQVGQRLYVPVFG